MNEARLLDALNNASSLELFRLSTVIVAECYAITREYVCAAVA